MQLLDTMLACFAIGGKALAALTQLPALLWRTASAGFEVVTMENSYRELMRDSPGPGTLE
jgi:hypothetical protein